MHVGPEHLEPWRLQIASSDGSPITTPVAHPTLLLLAEPLYDHGFVASRLEIVRWVEPVPPSENGVGLPAGRAASVRDGDAFFHVAADHVVAIAAASRRG